MPAKKGTGTSDENTGFSNRLREALGKRSVNAVAQEAGMSEGVLRKYLNGSIPGIDKAEDLARVLAVSFSWLATGKGDRHEHHELALASAHPPRAFSDQKQEEVAIGFGASMSLAGGNPAPLMSLIPVVNVQASAGDGKLVFEEGAEHYIAYSKIWLEKMRLTPSKLFMAPSTGESMVPTINPGEFLLCSRAEHHLLPGDGIYLIRIDGHVLVKRTQVLPGKRLKITSDNTAYQAYEIALNDGTDFAVLGKVMFAQALRWF